MVVTEIKNTDKPFPIEIPFNINLFAFKKENFEPENSKESLLKLIIEDYTKNKLITMEKPSIKKSELNIPITL